MRKIAFAAAMIAALACVTSTAQAQMATIPLAKVVADCSAVTWTTGDRAETYVDTTGKACGSMQTTAAVGAATASKQDTGNNSLGSIDTKLNSQATAANQTTQITNIGGVTETAPATDTASSGLNGRLQRVAQRLTTVDGDVATLHTDLATLHTDALNRGCAGATIANTNFTPISLTASARIATGVTAQKIYICAIDLVVAGANNVALVGGTGSVCVTNTYGMNGGSTAATGWNFAANGGLVKGNGKDVINRTGTNADDVCLLIANATQVSGSIAWVSQ
jgi:hypothetical protein